MTLRSDPDSAEAAAQAFWEFSLAVYAAPGVQAECLALQERLSLDVNLLLFAGYAGARLGLALSDRDMAELIAETESWHIAVVQRLRATRTAMKRWSEDESDPLADPLAASAATLRLAVKKAELDAERIEHDRLSRWAFRKPQNATAGRERAVESNIRLVLDHYARTSGRSAELPTRLIAAALA